MIRGFVHFALVLLCPILGYSLSLATTDPEPSLSSNPGMIPVSSTVISIPNPFESGRRQTNSSRALTSQFYSRLFRFNDTSKPSKASKLITIQRISSRGQHQMQN